MRLHRLTVTELATVLSGPEPADALADPKGSVILVDLDIPVPADLAAPLPALATLPAVVVGTSPQLAVDNPPIGAITTASSGGGGLVDVVVAPDGDDLDAILEAVETNPQAATALALVLRGSEDRPLADGLQLESAVYGALQGGPEFAAWRAGRPVRPPRPEDGPAVEVRRQGDRLELVLNRPAARNALDTRMRDDLVAGLAVATGDAAIAEVHLRGAGPAFCAGGDLDEFGSRPDVATAHLVRMARSPARAIAGVADRVVAHLHGACFGSGIELPAFAGRVIARED
ncbi:MAG TPA: enoyl-CoA hydratase/isomerase family protein, partial [Acidimicrobiales bacterium]|nr:enoyl-CoA hydratase/isomerase family protein [Acidimicrobiales bacterium]